MSNGNANVTKKFHSNFLAFFQNTFPVLLVLERILKPYFMRPGAKENTVGMFGR